jgi:UDP-glucose 4-epimerase
MVSFIHEQPGGFGLILVTGATGFIGSRLVDRLIQLGLPVVANFRTPREDVPRIWNTWIGDLAQPNVAARLISDTSPRQVIHLAGLVQSETALPLLRATFESNVLATFNLLSAVAESESPCPLIYAGTVDDCLGGLSPTTPYSLSKLVTREYFQYFQLEQPGRWCEARIYTGYGPGQSAGKVIPQLITTYLTGGVPNILHPNRVREWVYVEDIVDALVHLATSNSTLPTRVEVRSGVETRLSEVDRVIKALMGNTNRPLGHPEQEVVVPASSLFTWGWRPKTSLVEGLSKTVRWYRDMRES